MAIIKPGELETAGNLAKAHFEVDPNLKHVYLLESTKSDSSNTIALLEVVDGTLERGVEPISFSSDAARGVPYSSVIIEVSPREYKSMKGKPVKSEFGAWTIKGELRKDGRLVPQKEPKLASN